MRAYDGRTHGSLDVTVTVSNINEHAPVISGGSRTSFTYREEGASVLYTYRATDQDRDDVISWTAGGTDGSLFEFDDRDGLVFREPPDHEDPQDSGRDNEYNLSVAATDSGSLSASLDVTVTVTAVDEGPEITGTGTYTVAEGGTLAGADFTGRDPETPSAEVSSWRLAGSDSGDFTITGTGQNSAQLTFRNTPDYDRPADSNRDNEYLVTIRAYNGSTYGSLDVKVTVTGRNEAEPVVTGRDTLSFRENTSAGTRLYTYRAADADRDTTIAWHVRGRDGDDFTIGTGGELFFSSIPDHEQAADSDSDNVYEITVVASDGSNEGTLAVAVTVTDVNEGPEVTGTQSLAFDENTATDRVLATYTGRDPEDPSLEITRWSVTGRDGGDFSINEAGELTFRNPPDHERPADANRDNVYEVTVRASDGRVYGAHDVTVTVGAVDEAPAFHGGSKDSFSYRENGTASLHTYRATDPEGDEVAWSVGGADGGDFQIIESGVLTFREPPDHDDPADDDQDNEYQVTVVATDQTGHAANLPVTVTVTGVNEGPVIADTGANTAITVQENHDQVLATYVATDPEDPDLAITRWSVTGRDGGDFTINEDGELSFRNPPDHERPADSNRDNTYEVTIRASDGRYHGTLDAVVTVEAVDEAPEFQSNAPDSFAYQENGISAIHTYRASDPEGSDLTWSLSGTDSSAFSISRTGVLTFNTSPDYEAPTDSEGNNVYLVTVETSDRQSHTARLDVTVTVTNLTDARAVIRGRAQVGRTLTAETSGIPDEDTQAKAAFSYQWSADDMDVKGATDPTYDISKKDEGKTIRVRVTFTGNAGKEETLTSAATAQVKPAQSNEPATGLPTIDGTAQVGETLTADASGISDADGMTNAVFRYQWLADDSDISGATGSTHTVTDSEKGKAIKVRVSFTDDAGNAETLTSTATAAVAAKTNTPATGAPTISGTVQVGETLTADTSGISDEDGLENASFSYQWIAGGTDISGATGSSYTLTADEEGLAIQVWVSFTDDAGNPEAMTSDATEAVVTTPNSQASGAPTISGTAQVGETLTADTSGISDEDGLENASFSYQWITGGTDISGVTGSSYTLVDAEEGKAIKVRVSFTDDAGNEETLTSDTTEAVVAKPNAPATGEPTISGTAQVGETLTADMSGIADEDGRDNANFKYQWIVNDGNADSDIAGAASATYTPVSDDQGNTIKVRVSFTDDAGNEETLTSAATDAVAGTGPTEPPAKPRELTAPEVLHDSVTLRWKDPQDDTITGYIILRRDKDIHEEGTFETVNANTGTADTTYTDTSVDPEKRYVYRIKAINAYDESEISSWVRAYTPATPATGNTPATGAPSISGTVQVGETLTADTSGISDEDGFDNAAFTYQWLADDAEISGATGSSYTLAESDEGKAIKVRVSFTDDGGNAETLTSAATTAVAAKPNSQATGAPTLSGTAQVGETLRADVSSIADEDGLANATFSYQWLADDADIGGATGSTYALAADDVGKAIKVRVSFTDDAGNNEELTSAATDAVAARLNSAATGAPTISGTAQVWETLEADVSSIADEDGLENAAFAYQWLADDADITGVTDSRYTLAEADEGKAVKVQVSFTDDAGNEEMLASAATAAVAAKPNSPATGAPTISGTARVGETLTADTSGIADADGLDNATFTYRWLAADAEIAGATNSTYTLADSDSSKAIKVQVSFTDDAGNEETLTSDATETVTAKPNSPATGAPTISGTARVGETLTADTSGIADADGLDNATFTYRWLAADAEIAGATNSTYTLADADSSKAIKVQASFTDDAGNEETLTSAATAAVAARPNTPATGEPNINGTAQVGETLTADTSGIADEDGLGNVAFTYQWLAGDADISGATNSTHTLGEADKGKAIRLTVSFTDDAGNEETLTSAATDTVAGAGPTEPPAKPRTLKATEVSHDKVTLTWRDPQDNTITGYIILRRDKDVHEEGTFETVEANTGTADTTYTDTSVYPEKRYVYRIKAVNAYDESEISSWVRAYTPAAPAPENTPATGTPTISGTVQVGETLTADTSGIADDDGLENVTFSYQWLADDADIDGATASSYTLADTEEGKAVKLTVSFTDDAGNAETLTSAGTAAVEAAPNSAATGAPTITGTAQVAETLTADTSGIADADGLDNATFNYQWLAGNAHIAGATGSSYTLVSGDMGKAIKVRVSFTDDAGNEETLTSAATAAVAAPPTPLTAGFRDTPTSHDGQAAFTFELRFSEHFGLSYKTLRDHAFTVTGGEVTNARRLEQGSNARWEITVRPNGNAGVTVVLPVTENCEDQGAICTGGGRKLSNRTELTVSRPSG